ncbi:hypothetical protein Peur_006396 [Populus x canadensis]
MTTSSLPANLLLAEEIPKNYPSSVNFEDGYPYYYPSDWIDFDFRGHYSAFKDRTRQLQNVRVRFIPPEKKEIHELRSNGGGRKIVVSFPFHVLRSNGGGRKIVVSNCRRKKTISLLSTDLHLQTATIAIANGRSCTLIVTVEKISQSA